MAVTGQVTVDQDSILVERFLAGDTTALDELFAVHREKVYAIAMGVLGNTEDALDAVQDTFTLVHRNLGKFHGRSRFSTWLYRVATNSAIQMTRRRKARPQTVPLSEAAGAYTSNGAKIHDPVVHQALAKLEPRDRAMLALFYWEELPLEEIAAIDGCSANAAKTRLFRARQRFKESYLALGGEAGA
jgi:RNA polymerase sigma-70 factor, ECF subfamily